MGDGGIVGSHTFRGFGLNSNLARRDPEQPGNMFANTSGVRADLWPGQYQNRVEIGDFIAGNFHSALGFFKEDG